MKYLKDKRIISVLWTVIRIWLGYQWIKAGWEKVINPAWVGAKAGTGISGFLKGAVAKAGGDHPAVQGWYADFLKNFAIPNQVAFSYVVAFGELLVGIGLIVGGLTTIALLAGALMNTSYLLAGTTSTNPNLLVVAFLLIYVGANAHYYGIDRVLLPYLGKLFKGNKAKKATA